MIRACLSALLLLLIHPVAFAMQCTEVFPDGISTHTTGTVSFGFDASLIGSPDNLLAATGISKNGGSTVGTCNTADCAVDPSGLVETTSPGIFQISGGSQDVFISNNGSATFGQLGVNRYDDVSVGTSASVGFGPAFDTYYFDNLNMGFRSELNLEGNKVYWINNLTLSSRVTINVLGTGTAILIVNNSNFQVTSSTTVNSAGENSAGDASELVIYSYGDITFNNRATVSAVVYAQGDANLGSTSYLFGAITANQVSLGSESTVTYQSANVANADYGDLCDAASDGQLIAAFEFDEASWSGSGSVIDSSGNGNHGSPVGNAIPATYTGGTCSVLSVPSNTSDSVQDAIDTEIDINDVGDTGSISFWYRSDLAWSSATGRQLFDASNQAPSQDKHFYLALEGGNLEFGIEDSDDTGIFVSFSSLTYAADQWVHITATWDVPNNQVQLYVNTPSTGFNTSSSDANFEGELGDMDSLYIGDNRSNYRVRDSSENSANGEFEDFRIYNYVRSSSQIDADSSTEPDCADQQQLAFYQFEQSQWSGSNAVLDSTANNAHGTHLGAASPVSPSPQIACQAMDVPFNDVSNTPDGLDTEIDVNDIGEQGSISFWYKSNTSWNGASSRQLFDASNTAPSQDKFFHLTLGGDGVVQFGLEDSNDLSSRVQTSSQNFAANEWVHLAATWDLAADTMSIYINGSLAAQSSSLGVNGVMGEMDTLYIGDNRSTYFRGYSTANSANGQFDDVRIYSFEQSAAQIATDIADVTTCELSSLLVHFKFEEASWVGDRSILDSSGNDGHGSPEGLAQPVLPSPALSCQAMQVPFNDNELIRHGLDTNIDIDAELGTRGTISFWYKSNSSWNSGAARQLFDASSTAASPDKYFYLVIDDDGTVQFGAEDTDDDDSIIDTSVQSFAADEWVHVAATWDLSVTTMQIYLNGSLAAEDSSIDLDGTLGELNTLYIGDNRSTYRVSASSENSADGEFDDVRIYSAMQSQSEIAADMADIDTCDVVLDHIRIELNDDNGLTCEAESITFRACANDDCSAAYNQDVDITLSPASTWSNTDRTIPTDGELVLGLSKADAGTVQIDVTNQSAKCYINGGFDANCNLDFSDAGFQFLGTNVGDDIPMQIAQSNFSNGFLRAVQDNGEEGSEKACVALLVGTKDVDIGLNCTDPGTCQRSLEANGVAVSEGSTEAVSLVFDSEGVAPLSGFVYPDAGQIELQASAEIPGDDGDVTIAQGSGAVTVRPASLYINSAITTANYTAGQPFSMELGAKGSSGATLPNYRIGQMQFSVKRILPTGAGTFDGMLNGPGSLAISSSTMATPTFIDTGLSASVEGVNVDNTTGIYSFDMSFSEAAAITLNIRDVNYQGYTAGINNEVSDPDLLELGRFLPAYFDVSSSAAELADTCPADDAEYDPIFSYLGQPISFANGGFGILPAYTLTAYNADDAITQNYQGDDWSWLDSADTHLSATQFSHDNTGSTVTYLGSVNLDADGNLSYEETDPGSAFVTIENMSLVYAKPDSPLQPFAARVDMTLAAALFTDSTATTPTCYHANYDKSSPGSCEEVLTDGIGGANLRWGRLVLENAFGPENLPLLGVISTEYYTDGSIFTRNSDDNCTSFSWSNSDFIVSHDNSSDDYADISAEINVSADFTMLEGYTQGRDGLTVTAPQPTPGNFLRGQALIKLAPDTNWDSYLNFDWNDDGIICSNALQAGCSSSTLDGPEAFVTFGQFRGNDRIIHWREVFN